MPALQGRRGGMPKPRRHELLPKEHQHVLAVRLGGITPLAVRLGQAFQFIDQLVHTSLSQTDGSC